MLEYLLHDFDDDEDGASGTEDLSDTEADMTEFAKNSNGDEDLSDTEADLTKVQEGDQSG